MATKFGLPYLEAITKALDIVKRDAQHFETDENAFPVQAQVEQLMAFYFNIDPDSCYNNLTKLESNKKVLKEEAEFLLKHYLIQNHLPEQLQRRVHFSDVFRNEHLLNKYKLQLASTPFCSAFSVAPIRLSFPEVEFKLKLENPSFCRPLPESMKKYRNFKKEYSFEGIMELLPPGKKYGGFVKAYLHLASQITFEDHPEMLFLAGNRSVLCFQNEISKFRGVYNSSICPTDKRIQWFANLGIKADDCALWTRLFDEQYPGFKHVHKFFDQVA